MIYDYYLEYDLTGSTDKKTNDIIMKKENV